MARWLSIMLVTLLLGVTACQPIRAPAAVVSDALVLSPPITTVTQYGRLELTLTTAVTVTNPYDPAQIDLRVHFTAPDGQVRTVPAFWMQDFDPVTLRPSGEPGWRVRFTPHLPGEWVAQAELVDQNQRSAQLSFPVAPSDHPGFVRIHPQNPRYFAFADGSLYFPIGLNLGWGGQDVLGDYTRWFDRLSANGGNVARIWMASWSFGIEWNDTGLGDYTNRMKQAWLLDQVFQLAEKRGIYLMLTLINHGAFSTSVNPEWADNPYNAALGGPCSNPLCFVSDPTAKAFFKQRLRYVAARWAYSPNLFAWEWWNEVNWTGIGDQELGPWIQEMTPVLQAFDPYDHLITNSLANGGFTQLWALPELDFSQQHDYSGGDLTRTLARDLVRITKIAPDQPLLMGELGYSAGAQETLDAIHLHIGLWAAPFLGYAGGSLYWWWDTFVDPQNQWPQYKALADFFQGEELAASTPTTAVVTPKDTAQAFLLQSPTRALLWLQSDAYRIPAVQEAYNKAALDALKNKEKLTNWHYTPPMLSDVTVTVNGLADGEYTVQWYAPGPGEWLTATTVQVQGGVAQLSAPPFDTDLAAKLIQK
ncbi:MAG: DUF5060 domain-containing protein [Caldilineaceae bacterium]